MLWSNEKIKKMDCLDMALIKFSCIAFGLLLAILIPGLREVGFWWLVVIIVLLALRPFYRVYLR